MKLDLVYLATIPYTPNGRSPEEGFDCWGFVLWYYKQQGIELLDIATPDNWKSKQISLKDYLNTFKDLVTEVKSYPIPGDIILLKDPDGLPYHMALMYSIEHMIHFLEGYGFHRSPFKYYKKCTHSIWRPNGKTDIHI